jgi:hypothetical protein
MEKYSLSDQELKEVLMAQPHLAMQSFETLKSEITPVTLELMSRQATINIGIKYFNKIRNNWTCCSR